MAQNSPIAALTTLKECIMEYIDRAFMDRSKYRRLYPIAVAGLKELGTDVFMFPKTCKLTVEKNMTVKIPEDFMQYISVGVLNGEGAVSKLRYAPDMTTYADTQSNRVSVNTDDTQFNVEQLYKEFFMNYYFNYPYNNLYGVPSGPLDIGSFNIDYRNNVILLGNWFGYDYIILEYLAMDCYEDMAVPYQCKEALIAFIAWKDVQYSPNTPKFTASEKLIRRKEYYNQKANSRLRTHPVNLADYTDVEMRAVRLTVKS